MTLLVQYWQVLVRFPISMSYICNSCNVFVGGVAPDRKHALVRARAKNLEPSTTGDWLKSLDAPEASQGPEAIHGSGDCPGAPEDNWCSGGRLWGWKCQGAQWRDRCSGLQGHMVTDNKCALRPLTACDTAARAKWCRLIPRGYSPAWVTASTLGRRPRILNGRSHHCHSGKVWKTQGWPTRQPSRVHLQIRATI